MPKATEEAIEAYSEMLSGHTHTWQYDTARNRIGDTYAVFICECGQTKMVKRKCQSVIKNVKYFPE